MQFHQGWALLLSLGMCVFVPLGVIGAIVYVVSRRARERHAERMAMIAQGLVPPDVPAARAVIRAEVGVGADRDASRSIVWAVGLVVAGVLWLVSDWFDLNWFGILLTAVGAAYMTRGYLGMRGDAATPTDPPGGTP